MAVAFDGEAVVTAPMDGSGPTLTGKTTAGLNRIGLVHIGSQIFGGSPFLTALTWNGVQMTLIGVGLDGPDHWASLWYVLAPPLGASSIVPTFTGAPYGRITASSFSGVHQTVPHGTPVMNATATATVTDTAVGELVVDAIGEYNQSLTPGAGQTVLANGPNAGGTLYGGSSFKAGDSSPVVMAWTHGGSVDAIVAVSLRAALTSVPVNLTVYEQARVGTFTG